MPRVFLAFLCLTLLSSSFPASAQANRVDVAYVLANSQLWTYDVDPHTGISRQEGQPVTIAANGFRITPSPDGHHLYALGNDAQNNEHLWVYATDSAGAPQGRPIQGLIVKNIGSFEIAPNGKLAYAAENNSSRSQMVATAIQLFHVDAQSGRLNPSSKVVASFPQNGPCGDGWSEGGVLWLNGFNGNGSKLLDEWYCTGYDWIEGIYSAYDVNLNTGALGSAQQVFSWFEDSSADGVWFTPRAVLDYSDPAGVEGEAALAIYPPSGGTEPLFSCNAQMLELCASGFGGMPDPAGEYMFLQSPEY
jgi:hypothetical protein